MASEIVIDCSTGVEIIQSDTFLVDKPPPPSVPPPTTVAAGTGVGTSPPSPTLLFGDPGTSTDMRGVIEFGTGTTPTANGAGQFALVVVTFGTAYPAAPNGVLLQAIGSDTAKLGVIFPDGITADGFSIMSTVAPVASKSGTTYRVSYALG